MVRRAHSGMVKGESEPAAHNGAPRSAGRLVARINGSVSHELTITEGHFLIGRAQLCDIPLPSPTISRHHAMVVKTAGGVGVVDLGSTNGTFVDGKRVEKRMLQNGDLIRIGDCTITFFAGTD